MTLLRNLISQARRQSCCRNVRVCCTNPKTAAGLTLVELMIAITLGLVVTLAVSQIFVTSRSTYTVEEGLARVQEAGRFAMDLITNDVRMAGYTGCAARTITPQNNLNNPTDYANVYEPNKYLTGHTYIGASGGTNPASDWSAALPSAYFASADLLPNSDILVVRRGSEASAKMDTVMSDTSADLKITGNAGNLKQFDILMITSCKQEKADIFQITNPSSFGAGTNNLVHNTGTGNPGNLTKPFSTAYEAGSEILKLTTRVYYVGPGTGGKPALFRKELNGTSGGGSLLPAEELVEGIERLKVLYGIDTNNDKVAEKYLAAKDVAAADWNKVVSVRVGMLVRTLNKVDMQPEILTLDLLGTSYNASGDDRFYRHRAFNSTVQIRN